MNTTVIVSTIGGVAEFLGAFWIILANFDKRNGDRFDGLKKRSVGIDKQIEGIEKPLEASIVASKKTLRAEMKEMQAELRLEIREAGNWRIARR